MIFILFFSLGSLAGSFFSFPYYFGLLFIFLGIVFLTLFRFLKFGRVFTIVTLILFGFGSAVFWYGLKDESGRENVFLLEEKISSRVSLTAVIEDEPDERENHTRLIAEDKETKNRILIYTAHYPKFYYGDEVNIIGVLKRPSVFDKTDEFDWPAYLAKDDIYFEMFYPQIELISSDSGGSAVKRKLFSFKEKILGEISRVVPEPHSALLAGIILGAKRGMPETLLDDFRKTGIIHIVVLSGYNVTIVAKAIMVIFRFLPYGLGMGLGILGIVLFALMTGASATVVRAAIMAILVLLASATGRIYQITIALFTAGFLMILQNPKILRFDVSFQLSFLAALALIYLSPLIEPRLKILPKKWKIRELGAATISTQIFVLPLLLYNTGLFSLVSLPVNLLVLPVIPATMFFGFATAGMGFASDFLAAPFGWINYILLEYQIRVVEFFSSFSFSSFTFSSFPFWLALFFYVGYAILIYKYRNARNKKPF